MKKFIIIVLSLAIIMPSFFIAPQTLAVVYTKVCGVDGITYNSKSDANTAGIEVSYEFACVNPLTEKGLFEAMTGVNFAGQLIEIGSTDLPTNLIIKKNIDKVDYTIKVATSTLLGKNAGEVTSLSDWIPGDQILVIGKKNENEQTITATMLVNLSLNIRTHEGVNGWITKINKEARTITYKWGNEEHSFSYDANTKLVVGLKNPASVNDLKVNDRIRARLLNRPGYELLAKIIIVLRRGDNLFMKIRTFSPQATIVRIDSSVVPTTIQVKIEKTPGLKADDVNNLIGKEGALVTVNITEETRLVRKYFGKTTLQEFSIGDNVLIVGRINDDKTMTAKLLKNNSLWKTISFGHSGVVKEVNIAEKYLLIDWTPVKFPIITKLKEILQKNNVKSQLLLNNTNTQSLSERLRNRIKTFVKNQVGNFQRITSNKQININNIKQSGITLGQIIKREEPKQMKVIIASSTKIVIGTNANGTVSDIKVGDKIRVRGVRSLTQNLITAEVINIVSALPEIDEPLTIMLDDINEVVSELKTNDDKNAIKKDLNTETEIEITATSTQIN